MVSNPTLLNPTAIKLTTLSLKGLATTVDVSKKFLWSVPDNWSLDGAATVPVVYTTAFYALVVRGRIKRGDRVLIHSGSGGVGQAAISIALHHGCEVFTTVGSAEKKAYLKERFPQLTDKHFSNSRTTEFASHIMKATKGKGINLRITCEIYSIMYIMILKHISGLLWPQL